MAERRTNPRYGWNGWKMPFGNLRDPEYCEFGCPICRGARRGNPIYKVVQGLMMVLTLGGCWWGRARRRKYGVPPWKAIRASKAKKPSGP